MAALAGLAYDASGGVLVFALMADQVPSAGLLPEAAAAPSTRPPPRWLAAAAIQARRMAAAAQRGVTGTGRSTYGWTVSSTQMIDWDLAISTGTRWARPGPQVSLAEARRTVAELRDLAGAVQQPVYEVTGMSATGDGSIGPGRGGRPAGLDQGERRRLPRRPRAAGRPAAGTGPGPATGHGPAR